MSQYADINGFVTFTYTTLASDDNKPATIKTAVQDGGDWVDKVTFIMASNKASLVTGTVINPFNGNPVEGASVILEESSSSKHHFFDRATTVDGSYSIAMLPGSYLINFDINIGDANPYEGAYSGSHTELRKDGTIKLRSELQLSQGQTHTFNSQRVILTGIASNFPAGTEIYFTPIGTQKHH
ncbi:carboxypeptidase-like regulatory domain-containing protein [Gudongella sp. DL1XJH-153]|uniref:carboxypeptidase-like regulatory domain-containing protein n=1 Tax=Gudongella sp. DL1XJH-153 TaxID=3409804 RepID=UPI003BB6F3D3